MTTPAVAPYVPTYALAVPYLTPLEFTQSATGVDVSQLVPGQGPAANTAALVEILRRASGWADQIVQQVLAATLDVQVGEYRVFTDGTIRVPVANTPLIEVTDVKVGRTPSTVAALTSLAGLWIQRKTVRIPTVYFGGERVLAQVTYVNGYANTTLAADVAAAATSVPVTSPLGIFPGLTLGVFDGVNTEQVTVAGTYIQGSATVPLTAPLADAHEAGTSFSAMPASVKQAVVWLATALIKTRGAEAVVMGSMHDQADSEQATDKGTTEEVKLATQLLQSLKRVW